MTMRRYLNSRRKAECEHPDTVTTIFAGIERVVCEDCGHVSFGHHHDLVIEGSTQLEMTQVPVGRT